MTVNQNIAMNTMSSRSPRRQSRVGQKERYAADYKLFSKKVLHGAAVALIAELFLAIVFRDINSVGLLLGLLALVAGGYLTFRGVNALTYAQIGSGLLIMMVGFFILRHKMRKIAEEQE